MHSAFSSLSLDTGQSRLTWLRFELIKPANVSGVVRQNSQLSTSMLSAEDGERQGENSSELCVKKGLAGKAGLREKS